MCGLDDIYDRDGRQVDVATAARLWADQDYRRVAEDRVGPYWVSTVWLGVDHGHGRTEQPIIFETMAFATVEGEGTMDCRRYCTETEARAGHEEAVTLLRATVATDPETLLTDQSVGDRDRGGQ